jgi:hypothetical protein
MKVYATVLLAGLLALTGVLFGFWWAPFLVGLALGAVLPRARAAIPTSGAIGLLSWLVPLAAAHARYGLGPTATSLAAIMGFGHLPIVPVVLTLMVGSLLGLAGGWLGSAGRAVVASNARVDATRNG